MSNIQNISSRLHELRLQLTGLANDFDDRDEIPPSDIDLLRETASAIDELVALSTESECSANNTGIVIQSLTDSIRNRDAIITALRDENARAQHLLITRNQMIADLEDEVDLDTEISQSETRELVRVRAELLIKQRECEELKRQINGWRTECEIHEKDEKELYHLRKEVRTLRTQLLVSQNEHMDCDAQCRTLLKERNDARRQYCELVLNLEGTKVEKIAHFNGWNDLYPVTDNTPNLFEQKSDSDPVTGVQYGDLV